jgi:uncharacterized membrane protein
MEEVVEVTASGEGQTHWLLHTPLGMTISWDSQLTQVEEGKLLRWKSLPGSWLPNTGWVTFSPSSTNRGTEVKLGFHFDLPVSDVSNRLAKFIRFIPSLKLEKALYRFKSLAETGEIPTTKNQPAARNGGRDQ